MIVGMLDYALSPDQLAELRQAHRRTRDKREVDTAMLRRLGYVYKKPRLVLVPGKADRISAISRVRMIPSILWMRLIHNTIRWCLPAVGSSVARSR